MGPLEKILFLDPVPQRMRDPAFTDYRKLRGDGSSLSSVLFSLAEKTETKAAVLDFIRDLPEQHIAAIQFLQGT